MISASITSILHIEVVHVIELHHINLRLVNINGFYRRLIAIGHILQKTRQTVWKINEK